MKAPFREALLARSPAPGLLVRFPNWVGDAVLALPALRALRRSLPQGHLAVLARPGVADLVAMSGDADRLIPYGPGHAGVAGKAALVRSLRQAGLDGAVLLQNAFEAALLARWAGIPLRGGYATDLRGLLLTHPVAVRDRGAHQVRYYLEAVRSLGFLAEVDPVPRLDPPPWAPPGGGGRWAALAPGAAYGPAKMWPAHRFAELGRRLATRGFSVVVLGNPAEAPLCARVAAGVGPAALDLAGKTTLSEAASVLAGCEVAVTNDSGLMHLAAAVGAPLVALFGSTDPTATGPASPRAVVVRGSAPCAPCFRRECPTRLECLTDITVERAEEACERALLLGGGRR